MRGMRCRHVSGIAVLANTEKQATHGRWRYRPDDAWASHGSEDVGRFHQAINTVFDIVWQNITNALKRRAHDISPVMVMLLLLVDQLQT